MDLYLMFWLGQFWTLSSAKKGRMIIARQPLRTLNHLIWPLIILTFNSKQNSESKNTYIWYISTNWADLTPIGRNWPEFDLLWPWLTLKNNKSEFVRQFRVETYVYLIYFDQPDRFDPYWTDLTRVWPLMTSIDL